MDRRVRHRAWPAVAMFYRCVGGRRRSRRVGGGLVTHHRTDRSILRLPRPSHRAPGPLRRSATATATAAAAATATAIATDTPAPGLSHRAPGPLRRSATATAAATATFAITVRVTATVTMRVTATARARATVTATAVAATAADQSLRTGRRSVSEQVADQAAEDGDRGAAGRSRMSRCQIMWNCFHGNKVSTTIQSYL